MERFYLEKPSIKRKYEAKEYILEHIKYNSNISGSGGLDDEYLNYELWLNKLKMMESVNTCPINRCPGYTYFLIRENDEKIIGMINIRYNLTKEMLKYGGHIGYGIRPTERGNGYNKINLLLGLFKCREIGLDKVLLTVAEDNLPSYKTILSLGGVLENKIKDNKNNELLRRYWIDVNNSIKKYYNDYEDKIYIKEKRM